MTKSKIFLFLLLSFIGGIFLSSITNIPVAVATGMFVIGFLFLLFAFFSQNRRKVILGFCVLIFAIGIFRGRQVFSRRPPELNKNFAAQQKTFLGAVAEEPDRRSDFSQYVLKNDTLGRVLVKTGNYPEYFYGDVLKVSGKIQLPESSIGDSGFDYRSYLAKENIFLVVRYPEVSLSNRPDSLNFYGFILVLKKKFIGVIDTVLPEPSSSFLSALLVGARRTLPRELVEAFNKTGTTHIVAVSGYNISIISIMMLNFLSYLLLPRRLIFWIVITSIILFTLIAGAGSSVVRAAIMGALMVLAGREGRFYKVTNAIVFAGAVMLFFNPYLLRYDTGFQLSFLSAFGLIYLAPYFNRWFSCLPNFLSFRTNLSATLSAQIMTLPIIIWEFGRVSLVATIANVLVLPAIPLTMFFGFLAGLSGFISLKIAHILILPSWLLLSYQIFVVKFLSVLPWASI